MKTAAVVLVALQLAGLVHAQGGRCTNSSVRACVANLEQFELDEYDSIVPTFDDAQLTNLCDHYGESSDCLNDLIGDCTPYDQYYFQAVEASWDYICRAKRAEYLGHRECLSGTTLHTDADRRCTVPWQDRVTSLRQDRFRTVTGKLNDKGVSSLCNFANDYLNCIYTEVEAACSAEAASWQRGFDDALIQPLLRIVGCRQNTAPNGTIVYTYPNNKGLDESIIIIVAVAIALGIVVMVVIAILLIRQNKRKARRPHVDMHGAAGPGPYVVYGADAQSVAMGGAAGPLPPPQYKEKGDLGPEFGIPMPPPPSNYGPPPSYRPPESVYQGARSHASGRTQRSSRTHRSHTPSHAPSSGYMN